MQVAQESCNETFFSMGTTTQSGSTIITTGAVNYWSHLCEEEHCVCYKPNRAGVYHHFADGHFRGADSELPTEAGVTLTVQSYDFAINISENFICHHEP